MGEGTTSSTASATRSTAVCHQALFPAPINPPWTRSSSLTLRLSRTCIFLASASFASPSARCRSTSRATRRLGSRFGQFETVLCPDLRVTGMTPHCPRRGITSLFSVKFRKKQASCYGTRMQGRRGSVDPGHDEYRGDHPLMRYNDFGSAFGGPLLRLEKLFRLWCSPVSDGRRRRLQGYPSFSLFLSSKLGFFLHLFLPRILSCSFWWFHLRLGCNLCSCFMKCVVPLKNQEYVPS